MEKRSEKELGALIAAGGTADVYEWGKDQVLKLFRQGWPIERIEHEMNNTRMAHAASKTQDVRLKVPSVGNLVKIDGRLGFALERVRGLNLGELNAKKPWSGFRIARQTAELQVDLQKTASINEPTSQHQILRFKIESTDKLTNQQKASILSTLETLPEGDTVCHFDFHPWNILMTPSGPVIIDWNDANIGNPLADVASTWVKITAVLLSQDIPIPWLILKYIRLIMKPFPKHYSKRYFELCPGGEEEFETWKPIVAAAFLNDKNNPLEEAFSRIVNESYPPAE